MTADGKILGKHKGIACYTIGQRRGLELPMGHRVFVTGILPEKNQIVVGENEELFRREVRADHINFMAVPDLEKEMEAVGKIRYNHRGSACRIRRTGEDELTAVFEQPQKMCIRDRYWKIHRPRSGRFSYSDWCRSLQEIQGICSGN